jgi:hypothetical protein
LISFLSPEQDDFADDDEPVRRGAGVAGGRKASPAAKKSAISPPRGGGRNARRGPALAGDFAEDGIDDDDAALFGDEIDEGDALFVDEDDDGLLGDDEPLFADEVGGRAGAVGGRRSKGAAAGSATMAGKKKNNGPGQKKTPLQPEPDFRSGGAKAPPVGAARARGSSSDLTNAAAVGGAGRSRSNALPIAAATLDSRTNGRPASGTEDLDATAAANPLPRKLITSDLITMRNDDDMRVSGDSSSASGTRNGNGNGKERSGNIAGVAATHKNFRSKSATADVAVAAQNAERKRTAVAVASGLATFEAGANDADAAAAGARGGGRASSTAAAAGKTTAATSSTPPVVVALANRFYFGERYARVVPGCTWRGGASLPCEFTSDQARFADADAMA